MNSRVFQQRVLDSNNLFPNFKTITTKIPHMLSTFSLDDNIIGFIIDGPYDEHAVEKIQTEVSEKLEIYDRVSFYIEDTINADISLKAILKSIPFKIKSGNRFGRVAVVTDRRWLQVISNVERLFLNAEIRIFTSQQRLEAIQRISH